MKTIINIKADVEVKKRAQQTAAALGLPLSTLINAYLKQLIQTGEAHFSISPIMTPALEALIHRAEQDLAKHKNTSPTFTSGEDMDMYLDAS